MPFLEGQRLIALDSRANKPKLISLVVFCELSFVTQDTLLASFPFHIVLFSLRFLSYGLFGIFLSNDQTLYIRGVGCCIWIYLFSGQGPKKNLAVHDWFWLLFLSPFLFGHCLLFTLHFCLFRIFTWGSIVHFIFISLMDDVYGFVFWPHSCLY